LECNFPVLEHKSGIKIISGFALALLELGFFAGEQCLGVGGAHCGAGNFFPDGEFTALVFVIATGVAFRVFISGRHFWKTLMNSEGLGDEVEELFMGHRVSGDVSKLYNHKDKQGKGRIIAKAKKVFAILDKKVFL
jgi:hypothetical protein